MRGDTVYSMYRARGTHLLAFERLGDNPIRMCVFPYIRNSGCTVELCGAGRQLRREIMGQEIGAERLFDCGRTADLSIF